MCNGCFVGSWQSTIAIVIQELFGILGSFMLSCSVAQHCEIYGVFKQINKVLFFYELLTEVQKQVTVIRACFWHFVEVRTHIKPLQV